MKKLLLLLFLIPWFAQAEEGLSKKMDCMGQVLSAKNEWAAKRFYDICIDGKGSLPGDDKRTNWVCLKQAARSPTEYGAKKWFNFCKKNSHKDGYNLLN